MQIRQNFGDELGTARLYVCSTPIGNLGDASFRLVETLRAADVIAAEDTRHTRKLLTHFDIHPPLLVSYHEHNRRQRASDLVRWWAEGKSVALVTDAGTPGVSDPGEDAVRLAVQHRVPVIPVPGPSAVLAALMASGMPFQPFTFIGFLPRRRDEALSVLRIHAETPATAVLYEAPHRLTRTLRLLEELWPNRQVVLAKELTKRYESFLSGTAGELRAHLEAEPPQGEYVLVLEPWRAGPEPKEADGHSAEVSADSTDSMASAILRVREAMAEGTPHATAVRQVAAQTGVRRKALYDATRPED
ncbi:16S rRNA (cytidine(1402)-2'-O)-methyltransferase [Alicyclobacillus sp.]|uniref:16S rRNA (cytidine(1402)-2'-O)-methyltransferase n=1 Tax=Alicyclobacillus sp. TaxID=61169 RepID=UPI0025BABD72|nr:16S rRNA (cytidine(1402)-2'-O)-methyltransferase [Alicyclobacillus sp.]MCL6516615.1 16S rRNA (cytidine(1402)-2'-O)-methyltransferase [Alicyclobacillus sp.]